MVKNENSKMSELPVNIARVFPRRTKMTPNDENAFIGEPTLGCPHFDEIHISVTFSWDIPKAEQLVKSWKPYGKVLLGGPAFGEPGNNFTPGMYVKKGVVFTSRGCPNNCWYCFVPKREGKLRELPITEGNIIEDNNLLACSENHIDKVFEMLKNQKQIEFAGGLQASLLTFEIAEKLSKLNIRHIWISYDNRPNDDYSVEYAVRNLQSFFKRDKIRCYVLIGFNGDTLQAAEKRLRNIWHIGTLPFAMLYLDEKSKYPKGEWRRFQRFWTQPASIKAMMKSND